jgi:hypothetical protein
MIGIGFTVVEDVSYFINATAAFGGADQTGPVIDTFLIRVVAGGLYSHVLFAGLTGMGFAYFVTRRQEAFSRRLLVFGALVVAGAGAHFVWDSPWMMSVLDVAPGVDKPSTFQWVEYGLIKGLPFLLLLILMVLFATRSEEKNFRAIVAGEPDPEVITEPEIAYLGSLWSRRKARSAAGRIRGPQGSRLTGRLQAAQVEYAMIRSRSDTLTDPALDAQRLKIRVIRAQLVAVQFIPVAPAAPMAAGPYAAPMMSAPYPAPYAAPSMTPATMAAPSMAPATEPPLPAGPAPEPVATAAPQAAAQAVAQPQPQPAAAPIASAPPAPPIWAPTHLVPPGGMAAWNAPDPSRPAMLNLPERLELVVESRAGAWAQVRAVNGWRGWVDGRRLVDRG